MIIDDNFRERLEATFRPLNNAAASKSFPSLNTLSDYLNKSAPKLGSPRAIDSSFASYFGTAAVEMWLRSVHSFLISASLSEASPIWASVSGYYSSHYSVRGIAHLLGYFCLYKHKTIIRMEIGSRGGYSCSTQSKPKGITGGEHRIYWGLVKQETPFIADSLFADNDPDADESDTGHRNLANYADHISRYPVFHPLEKAILKNRIDHISKIVIDDIALPKKSKFPDVESVQLVAYRRIVSFREILDQTLGDKNRFWSVNRNPSFATEFMNFQLARKDGLVGSN